MEFKVSCITILEFSVYTLFIQPHVCSGRTARSRWRSTISRFDLDKKSERGSNQIINRPLSQEVILENTSLFFSRYGVYLRKRTLLQMDPVGAYM